MADPLGIEEIRDLVEESGLSTGKIFRMMKDFGIDRVSSAKVLRKFDPDSDDNTRASRASRQCMTDFFERWSSGPEARRADGLFVTSPLAVPVSGMTLGGNIVQPVDVWFRPKAIQVPLFADKSRWKDPRDVSLAAIIFSIAPEGPIASGDVTPNRLLNGMAAIIDDDKPLPVSRMYAGAQTSFWAVIKTSGKCPALVKRGAVKNQPATVIGEVEVLIDTRSVLIRDGSQQEIVTLANKDIEKIWPVICFLPNLL
tara:strand:- start:200 stop:964 length:765 start_codon:yes stop_codon:yes gene_type:complete